jgi:CRP/FNR family transcriptional regulator, cyclic AMP receptor protein
VSVTLRVAKKSVVSAASSRGARGARVFCARTRVVPQTATDSVDFSRFFNHENPAEAEAVESVLFLQQSSKADWVQLLDHCTLLPVKKGQLVFNKGDLRQSFFIVASGELEVTMTGARGKVHRLATVPKGAVFGEQAFFEATVRTADVRVLADGEVHEMTLAKFEVLAGQNPRLAYAILWDLARIVSIRLRLTTQALLQLKR